ncbi:hypothetical protein AJ87_48760 [Rhizobium yanglingense]|nr:hypothetical protein AJ87_48760 [Rhizobium yanglingense]
MIDRTRARIYTTEVGSETLLVKNWPDRILGDRSKNAAKLVEFFARAERLRSVSSGRLPRVRLACISRDGLFVLQDYLEGRELEGLDAADWTSDEYHSFMLGLVELIDEVHELHLPHGDLSPRNILVDAVMTGQ